MARADRQSETTAKERGRRRGEKVPTANSLSVFNDGISWAKTARSRITLAAGYSKLYAAAFSKREGRGERKGTRSPLYLQCDQFSRLSCASETCLMITERCCPERANARGGRGGKRRKTSLAALVPTLTCVFALPRLRSCRRGEKKEKNRTKGSQCNSPNISLP